MTFTTAELEEALDKVGLDDDYEPLDDFDGEGGWETIAWDWEDDSLHPVEVNGETVYVKVLEVSTGTYDGDTYAVISANGETYIKYGYTASHDGTYFDGSFSKAEPVEVTKTVWRRIRE